MAYHEQSYREAHIENLKLPDNSHVSLLVDPPSAEPEDKTPAWLIPDTWLILCTLEHRVFPPKCQVASFFKGLESPHTWPLSGVDSPLRAVHVSVEPCGCSVERTRPDSKDFERTLDKSSI